VKRLTLRYDGAETPLAGFQRTEVMAARVADEGQAICRLWHAGQPGLSGGRYHRLPTGGSGDFCRRHTGGRVVPIGPGVLCCTLVLPNARWLSPDGTHLEPVRVLNWSLRPLLALLRNSGADAFYAGRDLVTVGGSIVAYGSFTVTPDGLLIVEQMLSLSEPFLSLAERLARLDPRGTCATDAASFEHATALEALVASGVRRRWHEQFADCARTAFGCEVERASSPFEVGPAVEPASRAAFDAFQAELGSLVDGVPRAVGHSMLGLIEASAQIVDGRIHDLEISGDLISPVRTVQRISEACEGLPLDSSALGRAIGRVLVGPGDFLFGADRLEDLIARIG
jgi:hypothetical protein